MPHFGGKLYGTLYCDASRLNILIIYVCLSTLVYGCIWKDAAWCGNHGSRRDSPKDAFKGSSSQDCSGSPSATNGGKQNMSLVEALYSKSNTQGSAGHFEM